MEVRLTEVRISDGIETERKHEQCDKGIEVQRVKHEKFQWTKKIHIKDDCFIYYSCGFTRRRKLVKINEQMEVRTGFNTDGFHKASKIKSFRKRTPEKNCFSIVFPRKSGYKSLDFVTDTEESKVKIVSALQSLIEEKKYNRSFFDEKKWLTDNFQAVDIDKNGKLSLNEICDLFDKMNLDISREYAQILMKDAEKRSGRIDNLLDVEEYLDLFSKLTARPDLLQIMKCYSSRGGTLLDANDLKNFLSQEQNISDMDEHKALTIIKLFQSKGKSVAEHDLLGPVGFQRLMHSSYGSIMKMEHERECQDMKRPISQYFINSTHNTYLTGLQYTGDATVEGYINALKRGARLLELDVFDGYTGEPCITHKRTFITSISLKDALITIDHYAFQKSPYPVILTVENHVSIEQQYIMARIFTEVLGEKLYIPKGNEKRLPSPYELQFKYLLRGKKLKQTEEHEAEQKMSADVDRNVKLDPEYSRLISFFSMKLSDNLLYDLNEHSIFGSPSISERKVSAYTQLAPIQSYTAKRLAKAYPDGLRQDSSNMDPVSAWIRGIQCAALNIQTYDINFDLNAGLFQLNGGLGYILKPSILLDNTDIDEYSSKIRLILRIEVISGQYLPKIQEYDICDPYITMEIFGLPVDSQKHRTRVISNNGFNPQWNEIFIIPLRCPEVALLRFCVKDFATTSVNEFIGEYTIPIAGIKFGYSHIRLNTGPTHTVDPTASLFVLINDMMQFRF